MIRVLAENTMTIAKISAAKSVIFSGFTVQDYNPYAA